MSEATLQFLSKNQISQTLHNNVANFLLTLRIQYGHRNKTSTPKQSF
jgi:hypothetical protein